MRGCGCFLSLLRVRVAFFMGEGMFFGGGDVGGGCTIRFRFWGEGYR